MANFNEKTGENIFIHDGEGEGRSKEYIGVLETHGISLGVDAVQYEFFKKALEA